jgi:hypothetical protein
MEIQFQTGVDVFWILLEGARRMVKFQANKTKALDGWGKKYLDVKREREV